MIFNSRPIHITSFAALLCALVAIFSFKPAHAHPHAWIDLTVQVMFNETGKITGIRQTWLFDEFYTAFALGEVGEPGEKPSQSHIDAVMHENMTGLAPYSYFTTVKQEGDRIALAAATDMSSTLNKSRLEMTFVIPFEEPLDVTGTTLEYAVYDPTYYVEMLHSDSDEAIRLEGAPKGCKHRVIEPSPSMEEIMLAQALDSTETGGDGLGSAFAERVEVNCR